MSEQGDHLLADFPPVSTEEWEEQIRRDLGDPNVERTLLWHAPFGPTMRPYYRSEDLRSLEHLLQDASTVTMDANWIIRQDVRSSNIDAACRAVRAAVEGGVEAVGIVLRPGSDGEAGVPLETQQDLARLLDEIPLPETALFLEAPMNSPAVLAMLLNEIDRRGISSDALEGGLGYDPVSELARSGVMYDGVFAFVRRLLDASSPRFRLLQASAEVYHQAGADLVQETALVLASIAETAVRLADEGASAHRVFGAMSVSVPVSSSFLPEIARLRALRLLVPQVIRPFLPQAEPVQLPIYAATSARNMTRYDPYTNLLRSTTEAVAAVVGGCDVLTVRPFDEVDAESTPFAQRLARNIQHILRHEAYLDKVADPCAGSYYVEVLTDSIARQSWQLFKEIEARGGLIGALRDGWVAEMIEESRSRLEKDIALRRRALVGTNQYPDLSERRPAEDPARERSAGERRRRRAHGVSESVRSGADDRSGAVSDRSGAESIRSGAESDRSGAESVRSGAPAARAAEDPGRRIVEPDFAQLRRMFEKGAAVSDIVWNTERISAPLSPFREAENVEAVRSATERHALAVGRTPSVLVLPIGDPVQRNRRAHFAAHFMGCGGFDVHVPPGSTSVEEAVSWAREYGPDVLVAAAPDPYYGPDLIHEIRLLRGMPLIGIVSSDVVSDEVDFVLHPEADLVATLLDVQERLGMHPEAEGPG